MAGTMSEWEAYKTMDKADKTGVATVQTMFPFEIAELYREGLQTNNIQSEIIPATTFSTSSSE